ncbi:MAG TPA: hypothetical protein VFU35_10950, partial [Jatrophihabitans sp.]|nr:hypothetical protein [Jatrophihabitans sp.]
MRSARGAVDAAQERPTDALAVALGVLAGAEDDLEVQALASWAAGFAHRELNHLPDADAFLARAVDLALLVGRRDIAVGARTTRALVLANLGRPDEGLAELDRVLPDARGAELGRVQMQRALILQRQGRLAEALAGFAAALPELIAAGDRLAEIRLRVNRAIALGYRDEFAAAEDDLQRARDMAAELGQRMQGAACAHNLGFICGRRGDVPAALGWFDAAAAEYADLGVESGLAAVLLVDRATVLLDAGLPVEAGQAVARAIELLEPTGNSTELAEAQLLAARAALAAGDLDVAARHAAHAAAAFAANQRPTWAVLADWVHTQASPAAPHAAADVARRLAEAGLTVEAAAAHGRAGQLALDLGISDFATAELAEAARSRASAPVAARVAGWHAEALRQQVLGNRRASRRAVRLGLAELRRHRATLGATDLRAHAASYGEQLAGLAVADALKNGRAGDLLDAAELWRADALTTPAVPPADPALAAL